MPDSHLSSDKIICVVALAIESAKFGQFALFFFIGRKRSFKNNKNLKKEKIMIIHKSLIVQSFLDEMTSTVP